MHANFVNKVSLCMSHLAIKKKKQQLFFPEVYHNQLPLKFLIICLVAPILLKRFYCNRG